MKTSLLVLVSRFFRIMFFLAVPVFLSGCIASTEALLELTEKNSGETIRPEVGDFFMLRLPETAGTGYLWQTASPPYSSDVLRCLEDTFVPNPASAGMAGAAGRRTLTFKVIGPGTTGLKLEYLRPWETDQTPAQTFDLLVIAPGDPLPAEDLFGKPVKEKENSEVLYRTNSKGERIPLEKNLFD